MTQPQRIDSAYVEQELDLMVPELIGEAYPDRTYPMVFPVEPGLSPGIQSVTYRFSKAVGQAKIVEAGSREVPLVDIDVIPVTVPVKVIRLGLEYDTEDVRAGQLTGRPLDRDKMVVVLEGHEAKIDQTAWVGDSRSGIFGIISHPNVLRLVTSTTFDSASTPANILAALNLLVQKQIALTNGIERPNTLALSHEEFQYISSTPYSSTGSGDTRTILEVFKAGNPGVDQVFGVHWLAGAGVGSTNVCVAFNRARQKLGHLLAMVPTRNPISFSGVVYSAVYESKTGGIQVKKPYSVIVMEGI